MSRLLTVNVLMSQWLQDMVFAAAALLVAVEDADPALVTDDIRDAAAELRCVIERTTA